MLRRERFGTAEGNSHFTFPQERVPTNAVTV